nr:Rib/alpha-like domain-containing protein [uncultured Peptostreptococcus sp.]
MKEKHKQMNSRLGMKEVGIKLSSIVIAISIIVAQMITAYAYEQGSPPIKLPNRDTRDFRSVTANGIGTTSLAYAGITFVKAQGDTITLNWSNLNYGGTYWATVTDYKEDSYYFAGRYVLEFTDPEFYKQIESIKVVSGTRQETMENYYDVGTEKSGSLWTHAIAGSTMWPGKTNSNTISTVTIKLKNGQTLDSLGLRDKKIKFSTMWVTGYGGTTVPNFIAEESISSGYIYDKTTENNYHSTNLTIDGLTAKVLVKGSQENQFDEVRTIHQYKPNIKFDQSFPVGGYAAVIEEAFPPELEPFIDWDNVYICASDAYGNPKGGAIKTRIYKDPSKNGVVNTYNSPSMSHKNVKNISEARAVRAYIQKNILSALGGEIGFYTISYKLKDSLKDPEAAKKLMEATKQTENNSFLPFQSRIYADWPDEKYGIFKTDNGDPLKILQNSGHNCLLAVRDSDGDGLINFIEYQFHSNPNLVDTDGDGVPDGQEILKDNTKPNDATDYLVKEPTAQKTKYNPSVENKIKGSLPKPLIKNPAKPEEDLKVTDPKAGDAIVKLHPYDPVTKKYDNTKVLAEVKIPFDKLEKGEYEMTLVANTVENSSKGQIVAYAPNGEHPIKGPILSFYNPIGRNLQVELGAAVPNAKEGIENTSSLPEGASYTWKENPDTGKLGEQRATIIVDYGDGNSDEVEITITVTMGVPVGVHDGGNTQALLILLGGILLGVYGLVQINRRQTDESV